MKPKHLYEITANNDRYLVIVTTGVRDLDRALRKAGFAEDPRDLAGAGTFRRSLEWEGDPDLEGDDSDWEPETDASDTEDWEYSENRAFAEDQTDWLISSYELGGQSN